MTPRPHRQRLDLLLVERGLAESRTQAQALVMAGAVVVGETRVDKPGTLVDPGAASASRRTPRPGSYVSRGAQKLRRALEVLPVDPRGRSAPTWAPPPAASPTAPPARRGARLRRRRRATASSTRGCAADPRVVVRERENARGLTAEALGEPVDLVVGDLSFISLRLVLPAVKRAPQARRAGRCSLVKPQFEVGKGEVGKGGVVREEGKRRAALEAVAEAARALGFEVLGHAESPIEGPAGNREWLLGLRLPWRASPGASFTVSNV